MQVFISSLITGYEQFRDAAAAGVEALGGVPVRAEDFGASTSTPQQACLAGVRSSDLTVLLLGDRYGAEQPSGLSATHEEYREARDTKPVLVFIESGATPEPRQQQFIDEVQRWEQGNFTDRFSDAAGLQRRVTSALHNNALSNETGPVDEAMLARSAHALIPPGRTMGGGTDLIVGVTGGPLRAVLRPAELESESLRRFVLSEALTGQTPVLSTTIGTETNIRNDTFELSQASGTAAVTLTETGDIVIIQPAGESGPRTLSGITSLIEETVNERITNALQFAATVLDHIDAPQRITHIAPIVAVRGGSHMPWRTREEQALSPNQATMGHGGTDPVTVTLSPPVRRRAALLHDTQHLAEDFTVRLRRAIRP